jgi:hypothetical protein
MNSRIITADTGPLITLAAAKALDLLPLLDRTALVPDVVYWEATRNPGKPGTAEIEAWLQTTPDASVEYVDTWNGVLLSENLAAFPGFKGLDYGESAVIEVINDQLFGDPSIDATVVWEDGRFTLPAFLAEMHPNARLLSTAEFLTELEAKGAIKSATAVFDAAQTAMPDRNIDRLRTLKSPEHPTGLEPPQRMAAPPSPLGTAIENWVQAAKV